MEAGTGKRPGSARAWPGSSQVRPCAGRHLGVLSQRRGRDPGLASVYTTPYRPLLHSTSGWARPQSCPVVLNGMTLEMHIFSSNPSSVPDLTVLRTPAHPPLLLPLRPAVPEYMTRQRTVHLVFDSTPTPSHQPCRPPSSTEFQKRATL